MIYLQLMLALERYWVLTENTAGARSPVMDQQWTEFLKPFTQRENFREAYRTFSPFLYPSLNADLDRMIRATSEGAA